jgi:hypothetical protein
MKRNVSLNWECECAPTTELHLLNCDFFLQYPELWADMKNIEYEDIFKDVAKQTKADRVLIKVLKIYIKEKEKRKH